MFVKSQVRPLLERKDVESLQDSRMPGIIPREEFLDFVRVANLCVQEDRSDRPEMEEVVHRLTRITVKASIAQSNTRGVGDREEALDVPFILNHSHMDDTSRTPSGNYRGLMPTIGYRGGR